MLRDSDNGKRMRFCFTFDFDGASEGPVRTLQAICRKYRIPVTIFLGLQDNGFAEDWYNPALGPMPKTEIGLHPNFQSTADYSFVINKTRNMYLGSIGVRAHGLLCFSNLFEMYERVGLMYDSSYIIHNAKSEPFLIRNNLVELPIFFEDDVQLGLDKPLDISCLHFHDGVHIFNFHPIHVYKNDDVRDLLIDLIQFAKKECEMFTCKEIASKVLNRSKIEAEVLI